MTDRGGRNVALCVEIVTVTAQREKIRCGIFAALFYPLNVMQLQSEDISANGIAALISCFAEYLVANRDGNLLANLSWSRCGHATVRIRDTIRATERLELSCGRIYKASEASNLQIARLLQRSLGSARQELSLRRSNRRINDPKAGSSNDCEIAPR